MAESNLPSGQRKSDPLSQSSKRVVVIGVIGKTWGNAGSKTAYLDIFDKYPIILQQRRDEGTIKFYYDSSKPLLFVHFETTDDNLFVDKPNQVSMLHHQSRLKFARMLLFAVHICHIIVLTESGPALDTSYLTLFKSLKTLREKYVLRFLPKLVKNSTFGTFLGKDARLCSPRFIFYFKKLPSECENNKNAISKLEFELEDDIYKMLRNESIITNNSSVSLFSIPSNKRFVFYDDKELLFGDNIVNSAEILCNRIAKSKGIQSVADHAFGKCANQRKCKTFKTRKSVESRRFNDFLTIHIEEALNSGFDDGSFKFKGKSSFQLPVIKLWYETFSLLYKIFVENPENPHFEANDMDYKIYLDNFSKIVDVDNEFYSVCCDIGLKNGLKCYDNPLMTHYGNSCHRSLMREAIKVYTKFARGPQISINEEKLQDECQRSWEKGKQQCEYLSTRGNPCIKPKHQPCNLSEHSSGVIFISTCNCGKMQGRREDPYTLRQANFDFYDFMSKNCSSCMKSEKVYFPIFEPSVDNYRPAEVETKFSESNMANTKCYERLTVDNSLLLTVSQESHTSLSLKTADELNKIDCVSTDSSVHELVVKMVDSPDNNENGITRQPSTTEYLPGMMHTESPKGLLPQFPSWSLVCVGPSSAYSHNTGISDHFQSGFLTGSNYLLPWDVQVRLKYSPQWSSAYIKSKNSNKGQVLSLKIFIGCEYECPKGHRFIMSSPDKILRGGSGIIRDNGSKIAYNDMPLYFLCPCKTSSMLVAQLMRVHIVTPKAPVNVIIDPKVKTGNRNYIFTMGISPLPKLSQSSYWILRLPYVYLEDEGPILPPLEMTSSTCMNFGSLLAGMFGVIETSSGDE